MKALVVAEFYPRARDPVLGVWAHRQALAARDAGADVRVVVLDRPIPASAEARSPAAWRAAARQPRRAELDGVPVDYVRYLSPPRPRAYGSWGKYAAPALAVHLRRLRSRWPFDLVHAHNAVPAGDALLRAGLRVPLVVSVHGGDVLWTARRFPGAVERVFARARLVLPNSAGIERLAVEHGALRTRVVHLGTDLPQPVSRDRDLVATVGHLVARKRHADVIRALWSLRDRRPNLRYLVVGDGPEREALRALGAQLGVTVELPGQLPHAEALAATRRAAVFAMPSTDEAFGVAYIEAMAAAIPAIGSLGEPGPADIAGRGDGLRLVPPGDVEALAAELDTLLADDAREVGRAGRATVERHFTWERCGAATVAAYEEALR